MAATATAVAAALASEPLPMDFEPDSVPVGWGADNHWLCILCGELNREQRPTCNICGMVRPERVGIGPPPAAAPQG